MVIHVENDHQVSCNWFNEPFAASPYKSLYWDMHGLIFEASIWLLAGSTRYAHVHREAQLCCVARSAHQTVSRYSYWHFDLALQQKTPRIVLELSGLATSRPSTGTHSLGWLESFHLTRVPHTRPRPRTHSMTLLWWEPRGRDPSHAADVTATQGQQGCKCPATRAGTQLPSARVPHGCKGRRARRAGAIGCPAKAGHEIN